MRICYCGPSDSVHMLAYTDFMRDRGHDVHFVSMHPRQLPGVTNHPVVSCLPGKPHANYKYITTSGKAARVIRAIRPDIVHAHWVGYGLHGARAACAPLVFTVHGPQIHRHREFVLGRCVRYLLPRVDLWNPVSEEYHQVLRDELGVPEEKILVATLGVDTTLFSPAEAMPPLPPLRIAAPRTFRPRDGQDTVIRGLAEWKRRGGDFTVTFAAGGKGEDEAKALVRDLGLDDRAEFLGGYEHTALPDILRRHHLYVTASLKDGTSISMLEAMACGLVPVMSRIPANVPWVEPGQSGHLFEVGDAHGLADALQQVADAGPDWLTRAGERTLAILRAGGTRKTNLARLEQAYHRLLGEGGEAPDANP